jgi:hypothetical protein
MKATFFKRLRTFASTVLTATRKKQETDKQEHLMFLKRSREVTKVEEVKTVMEVEEETETTKVKEAKKCEGRK